MVAAVIWNPRFDAILIAERPEGKHKSGYWEFPGGKVEPTETAVEGLARELSEELSLSFEGIDFFHQTDFEYPEKTVSLNFYHVFNISSDIKANEGQKIQWVEVNQLTQFMFPEANQEVLTLLLQGEVPGYCSDHSSGESL